MWPENMVSKKGFKPDTPLIQVAYTNNNLFPNNGFNSHTYVEIKCQLDATGVLLQILLLAQHVSGITMPIIRSSRVLYSGCCLWYFVLWFFK